MSSPADQFDTVRSEGGLLPPSLLARVAVGDQSLPGMRPLDYHLVENERFGEAISRSWSRVKAAWQAFDSDTAGAAGGDLLTSITREKWLLPLFQELGYGRLRTAASLTVGDTTYPVSHSWGSVPIHLVGAGVPIDQRTPGVRGAAGSSPHAMVQELLNRSDAHLWAFVSNGLRLRLLRDNVALTRQAYLEFDLEAMMRSEAYSDFSVLWLACHQSRVEAEPIEGCWLETWTNEARTQGARALDHLRDGVEAAVAALGNGFLAHRANTTLRRALTDGTLEPRDYFRELMQLAYRILFLLVAEERDVLLTPDATPETRAIYQDFYSVRRLRDLSERRRGTAHSDLWQQLRVVFAALAADGQPDLGLPALGGSLFAPEPGLLVDRAELSNRDLMRALRALSGRTDDRRNYRWRFDYRNLGAEELGSVYESLLELSPELNVPAASFTLRNTGSERRATGSHYTPTTILKRVLDFALEPQVAAALAAPDPEAALLDLRILDPACGSGHFLIAAAHRIGQALASVRTRESEPPPAHVRTAIRDVTARCIYGVDYNPMAVELCKVALWLETLEPGKPLSFLDHHVKCGNSLLGVPAGTTVARNRAAVETERARLQARLADAVQAERGPGTLEDRSAAAEQVRKLRKEIASCLYDSWADAIPDAAFKAGDGDDTAIARRAAADNKKQRETGFMELALGNVAVALPPELIATFDSLGDGAEDSIVEVTIRAAQYDNATRTLEYLSALELAHSWTASWFWPMRPGEPRPLTQAKFSMLSSNPGTLDADTARIVTQQAQERRFLHFELTFPEIFTSGRGGFDIVIGNPPYLGGMKISTTYGDKVLHFLKGNHPAQTGGRADLAAYFVRNGVDMLRPGGDLCFITTNTIAQGDTKDAGLVPVTEWGYTIANAVRSEPWTGDATVSVAVLHLHAGEWTEARTLDGSTVAHIAPDLSIGDGAEPEPLAANADRAIVGTNVLGEGFWIDADTRARLIADDPDNTKVIKPFYGASHAMRAAAPATPSRWVIDFGNRSLEEASAFAAPMEIVRTKVKPQRDEVKRQRYRDFWWQFGERSAKLYRLIEQRAPEWVIVIPEVSKHMLPVYLPADAVYQHKLVVFPDDDPALFATLNSSFHWLWALSRCVTMRTDPTYNPGRLFAPFPLPPFTDALREAGVALDRARQAAMTGRNAGVTTVYNLVNNSACVDPDIDTLRRAHAAADAAARAAYGWDDLPMTYGVHPTERFGDRWTLTPEQQAEVVRRLLELNQARARLER